MKKKLWNRFANTIAWCVFLLSVAVAVTTMVIHLNGTENGSAILGVRFYSVASDSMSLSDGATEPIYFNSGDVILVREVDDPAALSVGDVITFVSESSDSFGKTVTHKIREVRRNSVGRVLGYVTYGIRTGADDGALVRPQNVIGVYAGKLPGFASIVEFLRQPSGYFVCILLPFALLLVYLGIRLGTIIGFSHCGGVPTSADACVQNDRRIVRVRGAKVIRIKKGDGERGRSLSLRRQREK